jgi:hypothetical protein
MSNLDELRQHFLVCNWLVRRAGAKVDACSDSVPARVVDDVELGAAPEQPSDAQSAPAPIPIEHPPQTSNEEPHPSPAPEEIDEDDNADVEE